MDPYVYPETNVLRNLRDIRDAGQLSRFEAIATTRRAIELEHEPIRGEFDGRHLQAIHRYLFQDVFEWAGRFRTVDISKSGDPFAFHPHIVSSVDKICGELKGERIWQALIPNASPFVGRITLARSMRFTPSGMEMGGHSASS